MNITKNGNKYLTYFGYEDWDIGDDDKLRVGDYINLNHQRAFDGYEQNIEGKIVLHNMNKLPVILYNIENVDGEESGDYGDLQTFFMDGWTFSRIKTLRRFAFSANGHFDIVKFSIEKL